MSHHIACDAGLGNLSLPFAEEPLAFEKAISGPAFGVWLQSNWSTSLYFIALYLLLLGSLWKWMEKRQRFEIQGLLALWNVSLAVFSALGAIRLIPELFRILGEEDGFHKSICDLR